MWNKENIMYAQNENLEQKSGKLFCDLTTYEQLTRNPKVANFLKKKINLPFKKVTLC